MTLGEGWELEEQAAQPSVSEYTTGTYRSHTDCGSSKKSSREAGLSSYGEKSGGKREDYPQTRLARRKRHASRGIWQSATALER